jgi:hypothetical protein
MVAVLLKNDVFNFFSSILLFVLFFHIPFSIILWNETVDFFKNIDLSHKTFAMAKGIQFTVIFVYKSTEWILKENRQYF